MVLCQPAPATSGEGPAIGGNPQTQTPLFDSPPPRLPFAADDRGRTVSGVVVGMPAKRGEQAGAPRRNQAHHPLIAGLLARVQEGRPGGIMQGRYPTSTCKQSSVAPSLRASVRDDKNLNGKTAEKGQHVPIPITETLREAS
ncbi:hypothetical protein V8C42DRAFT_323017 [Trichoderma barbatum]